MNKTGFADTFLTCKTCGKNFVFEAGEAAYFNSLSFSVPKHCPDCRDVRRLKRVPDVSQTKSCHNCFYIRPDGYCNCKEKVFMHDPCYEWLPQEVSK